MVQGVLWHAQALMAMITSPEALEGGAAGAEGAGTPVPVALFALGNMAGHREIADVLVATLGVERTLDRLALGGGQGREEGVSEIMSAIIRACSGLLCCSKGEPHWRGDEGACKLEGRAGVPIVKVADR